jgi:hypothetical protein
MEPGMGGGRSRDTLETPPSSTFGSPMFSSSPPTTSSDRLRSQSTSESNSAGSLPKDGQHSLQLPSRLSDPLPTYLLSSIVLPRLPNTFSLHLPLSRRLPFISSTSRTRLTCPMSSSDRPKPLARSRRSLTSTTGLHLAPSKARTSWMSGKRAMEPRCSGSGSSLAPLSSRCAWTPI